MARTRQKISEDEKKARRREQKRNVMRKWREKIKNNPVALEDERRKARERYYKRKEKGLVKSIKNMTAREQRAMKKKWREQSKLYRDRKKVAKLSENTKENALSFGISAPPPTASSSRAFVGRKVALRNRTKIKLENINLKNRVKLLENKIAMYRMRETRKKQKNAKEKTAALAKQKENKRKERQIKIKKLRESIIEFYLEDSSSRLTASKKETITRKKVKKQVRLLNDTLQHLHEAYVAKSGQRVSYTFFCLCRPFWVIRPCEKKRNTCLCATHCNMSYLIKAMKNAAIINDSSTKDLLRAICCPGTLKENCLERRCAHCKNKKVEYNKFIGSQRMMFEKWLTKKVRVLVKGSEKLCQKTVKEKIIISKREATKLLEEKLGPFMKDVANIIHQYKVIHDIKSNMTNTEALIHIDFSENYCCKYGEEVQSAHFGGSKPQISLHTVVLYSKSGDNLKTDSICTVSENICHDSVFVCAHLTPLFELINKNVPSLDTLHILSDGACNQYRNWKMFQLIVTYICPRLNISTVMWHYNEAGHGKGAPDGVGGCLKRTADRGVALGKDVNNFESFVSYLTLNCDGIHIIPIDDNNIEIIRKCIEGDTIRPFKGTLSVHQITWSSKNLSLLRFRRLSCDLCLPDEHCYHYELGTVKIPETALADAMSLLSLCNLLPPESHSDSLSLQSPTESPQQTTPRTSCNNSTDTSPKNLTHYDKQRLQTSPTLCVRRSSISSSDSLNMWCGGQQYRRKMNVKNIFSSDSEN